MRSAPVPDEARRRRFDAAPTGADGHDARQDEVSAYRLSPMVEGYLREVFAPLAGRMPPARVEELRAELAAHVEALVEAHRELGSESEAALRAALAQMGNARHLSRLWARQCRRSTTLPEWRITHLSSAVPAGVMFLAGGSLGAGLLVGLEQHLGHNLFELALGGPLLPLAAGALVGLWRGRHPLGSRAGLLLIALAGAGISLIMSAADPRPPVVLLLRVSLWLMAACASAGLGALLGPERGISAPPARQS